MVRERRKKRFFVGADPGKTGAIAVLRGSPVGLFTLSWLCMPCIGTGYKWKFDYDAIQSFLQTTVENFSDLPNSSTIALIEDVHSMPRDGVKQAFSFGRAKEALEATFAFMQIPYDFVSPNTWKKEFTLTRKTKADSVATVQRLFPGHFTLRNNTKAAIKELEGPAEASLIAYYAWKNYGGK